MVRLGAKPGAAPHVSRWSTLAGTIRMLLIVRLGLLGLLTFTSPAIVAAQEARDATPAGPKTPGMGQPGQTIPGSPDLSISTVTMNGGIRTSKIVGAAVFNGASQQVGTVDDLIMDHDNRVVLGVISVGGFLGVGGKLVAVPFSALHVDAGGKVTVPDASKEALDKMPGFTYGR